MNVTNLICHILKYCAWLSCLFPAVASATQPRGMVGSPTYHSNYYQPTSYSSGYGFQAAAGGYAPASHYQAQLQQVQYQQPVGGYRAPTAYPVAAPANYPTTQAYYPPQPAPAYVAPRQYAPVTAYSNPQGATFPQQGYTMSVPVQRPTSSYRVTYPAGDGYTAYAPQVAYRPVAQQMTYLRPVTVYDPITARQVTYYAPCTGNTCYQAPVATAVPTAVPVASGCGVAPVASCGAPAGCQSRGWFSNCRLFNCNLFKCNWFNRNTCYSGTCAPAGCGAPVTCGNAYAAAPAGCGAVAAPYYTQPQPGIPVTPGTVGPPIITNPPITTTPVPRGTTIFPGARQVIPPPGTRAPGSLAPSGAPSTFVPSTIGPAGTAQPPSSFPATGGAAADTQPSLKPTTDFGSSYPPATNGGVYSAPTTSNYPAYGSGVAPAAGVESRTLQGQTPGVAIPAYVPAEESTDGRTPATRSSVKPFADPDAAREPKTDNRAPQLLDPRDRTAQVSGVSWPTVPAKWPTRQEAARSSTISQPRQNTYREMSHRPAPLAAPAIVPISASVLDDTGWTAAE